MAKDPVCGMDVDETKAGAAVYKEKTYFFCAPGCKATFLKTPEKYVKSEKSGKGCCA